MNEKKNNSSRQNKKKIFFQMLPNDRLFYIYISCFFLFHKLQNDFQMLKIDLKIIITKQQQQQQISDSL